MSGKGGSIWIWVSAGLICLVIIATYFSVYYYMETQKYQRLYKETLQELSKFSKYMVINIMIDYGNGSTIWYNNTAVVRGANLFEATKVVAEVDYIVGEYGVFVTHINGVGGENSRYWIWYFWNATAGSWNWGPVACNAYILSDGENVAWRYEKF